LRVSFTFRPKDNCEALEIPIDFRRHLISFVKKNLSDTPFFRRFEADKPGYSPYVFGVSFGRIVGKNNDSILIKPPVVMVFSTGYFDLIAQVCNGAIAHKQKSSMFGLRLTDVNLLPFCKIHNERACFRIVGHAVFRGEHGYVDTSDPEGIEEALNTHLQKKLSFLSRQYGEQDHETLCRIRLEDCSRLRKGVCHHYGGKLTTVQGEIVLTGKPELLQFVYDFGLGVRNGQGFGLVEVDNRL